MACGTSVGSAGRRADDQGSQHQPQRTEQQPVVERVRDMPSGDVEHGGRGVGGDDPVPGVHEVTGEQAAAAPHLHDGARPRRHRLERLGDKEDLEG